MLAAALCTALFASAAMAVDVDNLETLKEIFSNGGEATLTQSIESSETLQISGSVTLDLKGFNITGTAGIPVINITDNASLTVNDNTGTGAIVGGGNNGGYYAAVTLNGTAPKLTVNNGWITGNGYYSVGLFGDGAEFTLNGGTLDAVEQDSATLCGNGAQTSNSVMTINGGQIIGGEGREGCAIYHPQSGTLYIHGGEISGYDGVQLKGGTLVMDGGKITATGNHEDSYTKDRDGNVATGSALSLLSQKSYKGNISVTISGDAEISSEHSYAILEDFVNSNEELKTVSVNITGGTFKGGDQVTDNAAVSFANYQEIGTFEIDGGTYSSDISNYLSEGIDMEYDEESGNYYVVVPATQIDIDLANISNYWVADKQAYQLTTGQMVQLGAVMTPPNTTDVPTWYSNDETVATVDQTGLLTAVNVGETAIGVTVGSGSGETSTAGGAAILIHVVAATIPATDIGFVAGDTYEMKLSEFDTVLKVTYTPTDATTRELVWSSSDTAVATVDAATGKITPLKAGKTTITAALADNNTVKATCEVTVIDDSATSDDVTSDDVKPQPSGSGGGGCSAGFGALALLAALPLLRMRKK